MPPEGEAQETRGGEEWIEQGHLEEAAGEWIEGKARREEEEGVEAAAEVGGSGRVRGFGSPQD